MKNWHLLLVLSVLPVIIPLVSAQSVPINPKGFWCENEQYLHYTYYNSSAGSRSLVDIVKDCFEDRKYCCFGWEFCGNQSACCMPYRCALTSYPCTGSISLTLTPNPVLVGKRVTAIISTTGSCYGKAVYIKRLAEPGGSYGSCEIAPTVCQCTTPLVPIEKVVPLTGIPPVTTGYMCSCSFSAPSSAGDYVYAACIDKNGDLDFSDEGEMVKTTLKVLSQPPTTTLPTPPSPPPLPPLLIEYTLTLKKGWNLVSIPFKEYEIASVDKSVYPKVYWYNPLENKYEIYDIKGDYKKLQLKGLWIYSFEDNQKVTILGTSFFSSSEIPLYFSPSGLTTPNQIAIPYKGIYLTSEKGDCVITHFYYWNTSESTWYKWNATTGEYLRYNYEKNIYEVVGNNPNPFISDGMSIFLYVKNQCKLGPTPPPSSSLPSPPPPS